MRDEKGTVGFDDISVINTAINLYNKANNLFGGKDIANISKIGAGGGAGGGGGGGGKTTTRTLKSGKTVTITED